MGSRRDYAELDKLNFDRRPWKEQPSAWCGRAAETGRRAHGESEAGDEVPR